MSYESEIQCRSCFTVLDPDQLMIAGVPYVCPGCGDRICYVCGCTESRACAGGCYWISSGICSSHKEGLLTLIKNQFGSKAADGTRRALAAYEEAHA